MSFIDFLWVFASGGWFGWIVHEVRDRHSARSVASGDYHANGGET